MHTTEELKRKIKELSRRKVLHKQHHEQEKYQKTSKDNSITGLLNWLMYFSVYFVRKPHHEIGPDGMFYLRHVSDETFQLVRCVMTMVADADNALNMFRSLSISNEVGWIVSPNIERR